MPKRQVFYSFKYKEDVFRVQQIRNIGALEDNKPVSENAWEEVMKKGDKEIKKWIDNNIQNRSCVIVLIGEKTYDSKWVKYEIEKAYNTNKGVFGIYIHNLKCPKNGKSSKGKNPFSHFTVKQPDGSNKPLTEIVSTYSPPASEPNKYIIDNLESWVEKAIEERK